MRCTSLPRDARAAYTIEAKPPARHALATPREHVPVAAGSRDRERLDRARAHFSCASFVVDAHGDVLAYRLVDDTCATRTVCCDGIADPDAPTEGTELSALRGGHGADDFAQRIAAIR